MVTREFDAAVTILPIGEFGLHVVGVARASDVQTPFTAFIVDSNDSARNRPFASWRDAIDFVEREYGPIQSWDEQIIRNRSYRVERLPFQGTPAENSTHTQTAILSSSVAISLLKAATQPVQYRACVYRNRGQLPWSCEREIRFTGP
jgi:hypothetical protein